MPVAPARAATLPVATAERELALAPEDDVGAESVPPRAAFERWVEVALAERAPHGEVHVRVVGPEESRTLNHRWRGRDAATNVLAFPVELPAGVEGEVALLGDLVICAAVVAREAEQQGKPLEAHWAHITVHGTLHLLGYDHQEDAEAAVMEREERRVLAALGYPDPYPDG